jgi:4-hydroxybenzoate polyprenyltransferase
MVRGVLRSLRPRQWPKNAVVLAGLLFARELGKPDAVVRAVTGAILFCLLSSTVYLVNDVLDCDKDRLHPTKRHRPIAAGIVPIPVALVIAAGMGVASLAWSIALEPAFGGAAATYLTLQALYVVVLKHLVILDVLAVAGGFVIRAAAGAFAIGVPVSPWLYVCTMLLALFLALGKRRQEIALLAAEAHGHRPVLRGYTLPLVDHLIGIVTTALLVSYMLYTFTAERLPENHAMMLTIPFPIYGVFRYLYLIHVRGDGGAPEEVLLRDRPIALVGILWVVACIAILYSGR